MNDVVKHGATPTHKWWSRHLYDRYDPGNRTTDAITALETAERAESRLRDLMVRAQDGDAAAYRDL